MGMAVARRAGGGADGSVCRTAWRTRSWATTAPRRPSKSRCSGRNWNSRTSGVAAVAGAEFDIIARRPSGAAGTRRSWSRRSRTCGSASGGAARARTWRSRRHRRAARARQPLDACGQRDGRVGRPCRESRRPHPARRSADATRPTAAPALETRGRTAARPRADPRAAGPASRLLHARCAGRAAVGAVRDRASNSDRMGFRLDGPRLTHARGADIISDATPLGVLQVPASGQPILLMADRQTAGGYPKIATVISADMAVAGQLGPGDTIAFVGVHAARSDGGADRAGTRADGAGDRGACDRLRGGAAGGVRRRSRCGRTCRSRRSRPSASAVPADWLIETRSSDETGDGARSWRARPASR